MRVTPTSACGEKHLSALSGACSACAWLQGRGTTGLGRAVSCGGRVAPGSVCLAGLCWAVLRWGWLSCLPVVG
jgi:hypothetical protein